MFSFEFLCQSLISFASYVSNLSILGLILFNAWTHWRGFEVIRLSTVNALSLLSLACLASCAHFLFLSYQLSGDWEMVMEPAMLSMLWQGGAGDAVALVCLSACLFWVINGLSGTTVRRAFGNKIKAGLSLGIAILLPLAFTQTGHISPSMQAWPLSMVLVGHLYLLSFWFVSVIVLLRRSSGQGGSSLQSLAHAFGLDARFWLPILLLSGGIMAYQLVTSWQLLLDSVYGQVVIVKVILVLLVVLCGALNKLVMVPRLAIDFASASRSFRRVLRIELSLLLMVLGVTSALTSGIALPI